MEVRMKKVYLFSSQILSLTVLIYFSHFPFAEAKTKYQRPTSSQERTENLNKAQKSEPLKEKQGHPKLKGFLIGTAIGTALGIGVGYGVASVTEGEDDPNVAKLANGTLAGGATFLVTSTILSIVVGNIFSKHQNSN